MSVERGFARAVGRNAGGAGLVVSFALAAACGGGSGSPTTPVTTTPTTTLPPPSVVLQDSYAIQAGWLYWWYFTTSRTGTIDVSIDYTYPTNPIVIWIARGNCTGEVLVADQCDIAATSFAGSKPRKVSVTAAAAGNYTLLVGNAGEQDDSISFQVVLTPTASTAGPAATIRVLPGPYPVRLPQP
jgi:hypothetical protein